MKKYLMVTALAMVLSIPALTLFSKTSAAANCPCITQGTGGGSQSGYYTQAGTAGCAAACAAQAQAAQPSAAATGTITPILGKPVASPTIDAPKNFAARPTTLTDQAIKDKADALVRETFPGVSPDSPQAFRLWCWISYAFGGQNWANNHPKCAALIHQEAQ